MCFYFFLLLEAKSTLPLSSEDVTTTVSSATPTNSEGREDVDQLQRESGDGASSIPNDVESTNAYHRRTKVRNGSLFDDEDEEEDIDANTDAVNDNNEKTTK